MHALTFSQSAYVMEACIKGKTTTPVTLQTTSRLKLSLKYRDAFSSLRQETGTHQAAKAAPYDYHIPQSLSSFLKTAGCST